MVTPHGPPRPPTAEPQSAAQASHPDRTAQQQPTAPASPAGVHLEAGLQPKRPLWSAPPAPTTTALPVRQQADDPSRPPQRTVATHLNAGGAESTGQRPAYHAVQHATPLQQRGGPIDAGSVLPSGQSFAPSI